MSDNEIIAAILKGNINLFRLLVGKYEKMVFRTCMGFVHYTEDAEDLAQEIFISAYQSLSKFKGESTFSTWLYRIAINASLNYTRKRSVFSFLTRTGLVNESGKEIAFPGIEEDDPEKIIIRQDHSKWIQEALDSLPEKQRTAIILSKYEELSQKEIADVMKITEGAVEALIQRAKKNLREKLSSLHKKNQNSRRK